MTLRPEYVKLLQELADSNAPQLWEVPISETRSFSQAQLKIAADLAPIHSITDRYIPGPTADLHLRIFRPDDSADLPCIIYFHGSGWTLGFIDLFNPCLSMLSQESESIVIAVNYQKAPEHPFPIPFDDCYATLLWVIENARNLNIDPATIGVAGDSAGANLASAVAIKARDNNIALAFQLLIYPCNDRDFTTDSYLNCATGYGLSTQAMQWFWDQYLQGDHHDDNPYAVPMKAKTFKDIAPAIIITAQYDPLLSDSQKYGELLERDGVSVTYKEYAGMIHGFFSNLAVTPTAREAIDFAAVEIKRLTQ